MFPSPQRSASEGLEVEGEGTQFAHCIYVATEGVGGRGGAPGRRRLASKRAREGRDGEMEMERTVRNNICQCLAWNLCPIRVLDFDLMLQ